MIQKEDTANRGSFSEFEDLVMHLQRQDPGFLLVGIDVAKRKHAVSFGTFPKVVFDSIFVKNNDIDFRMLSSKINSLCSLHNLSQVVCAVESTGNFGMPLINFLRNSSHLVTQVSTKASKANRGTIQNSFDKNDRADSLNVLDLLFQGKIKYLNSLSGEARNARILAKLYSKYKERYSATKTRLKNNYISEIFPEVEDIYTDLMHPDVIRLFRAFPSPLQIAEVDEKRFIEKAGGQKPSKPAMKKLKQVYKYAQNSIGCIATESHQLLLAQILDEGCLLSEKITETEAMIKVMGAKNNQLQLAMTIPGIGKIIGSIVMAYINNIDDFDCCEQLLNYFGMNLASVQSGTRAGQLSLSKAGHSEPRFRMHQAAQVAVNCSPEFKAWYAIEVNRRRGNRFAKRIALTKVAAKLTTILYGVLKSRTPYNRKLVAQRVNSLIEKENSSKSRQMLSLLV